MKKWYRVLCLAISILLTGYLFVHVSYMHRSYTRLMGFYSLEKQTVDVVLLGTSVTFSAFMPMEAWNQYGMAAYDYCTNIQFENALRYNIKEVMKTQSPKLILIDIAPFMYQHSAGGNVLEDSVRYNLDSMPYSMNRMKLTYEINKEMEGDLYSFLDYYFDIGRYHSNTPTFSQYNNAIRDVNRGYGYFGRNSGVSLDKGSFETDNGNEKPLSGCHADYFEELLSDIERLDCNVVFFCAPIATAMNEEYGRKNYIKRIVEERGYVFWDLTAEAEAIGLDYEYDFWGINHWDSLGAAKITNYLAKKIKDSYDIPDRRGDSRYAGWEEDYQSWTAVKEEYNAQDMGE